MVLSELTDRDAVLAAIREYDTLGQDGFLQKYGYGPARDYLIEYQGRSYDSKAIAGAAYGYQFPERGPLKADQFTGGQHTVEPILTRLGFEIRKRSVATDGSQITAEDIALLRASRTHAKYADLSPEQAEAYRRVHGTLEHLGQAVVKRLGDSGNYVLKLTSGFNPQSGVRGGLPKDLWFGVSSLRSNVGMPQLYMIVSTRGIEYGYAPAIHPSDFTDPSIKRKVKDAAPTIFASLPAPGEPEMVALKEQLAATGPWYFRRKARLDPKTSDFPTLDAWLDFLKSPSGARWAGGSISAYLNSEDLETQSQSLQTRMEALADVFGGWIKNTTLEAPSGPPNPLRTALEEFLTSFPNVRQTSPFGQHDSLKDLMKTIRLALERLPALRQHPQVKVSWSLGAGNWARIPWIALMDERETDSTQRGTYVVCLFPEDMSGVYLTLNQGVTDVITAEGRQSGRTILRNLADKYRGELGALKDAGFALDNEIDLRTEGTLGQEYEARTIAYKHYAKGQVPEDKLIEKDLSALLASYADILDTKGTDEKTDHKFWIFQANPTMYDIDGALDELKEITWLVSHFVKDIKKGDKVALWRSGKQSGVVALATVMTDPAIIPPNPNESKFTRSTDKFDDPHIQVWLRIDELLKPEIPRARIMQDPTLSKMTIITAPFGTNFAVSKEQERVFIALIRQEQQERTVPDTTTKVWVYAPGRNADRWDDFYEQGIMAIGWDELGDLSKFGSTDDVATALDAKYPSDSRQSNNARTCFDFAQSMNIGDLVFVKRGRNLIIGHGIVTGDYEFRSDRADFRNVRTMRWEGRGEWPTEDTLALKTLTEISNFPDFVEKLKQLVALSQIVPQDVLPPELREKFDIDDAMVGLFMPRADVERALRIWRTKKNLILQGAPGVGKSFVARKLAYALIGYRDPTRVRTIQFHQSYSYEDFVQGYRPDGQRGFELKPGVFLEFCEKARADSNETYVFIVDEINRGNLSRIFGELMLLIEPDKRSPEWATKLAYAKSGEERFYVPPNVHILGLMNTADRSLSLVDYALRRRFGFVTLKPQFDQKAFRQTLEQAGAPVELIARIVERLTELNGEIASDKVNLGPGFCIGHSFFVPTEHGTTPDARWYDEIIETEIWPLLEEYWSDDLDHAEKARLKLLAE